MKEKIKTTKSYKAQAIKATLAITLFLITYLLILFLVIILTLVCIALGAEIFGMYPLVITIPLGLGLASLGIMILIFQLKFIFSKRKIYGSQLLEITQEEEPQLFKLIQETVSELGTYTPKKVFLSAETNASVFYEPNFLSLFIPSKKNLILGIGLVNMVTKKELKGILAHEFGHFSQKNMQLDSYVYKINNIIYSTLFEHESYEEMVENWSRHSPYFVITR